MALIDGDDGVLDDPFPYTIFNKLKNHWYAAADPANIQNGMIRVDSAGKVHARIGGATVQIYPLDEISDADGDTKAQTEEAADEDIFRIDAGGSEVAQLQIAGNLQPLQPAFCVEMSADQLNIATGAERTVLFDTERFDQGGNFNVGTYTFTAPITGKYLICASLYLAAVDTAADFYRLRIHSSNDNYDNMLDPNFSADLNYQTLVLSHIIDMDVNDTVYITLQQNAGAAQTDIKKDDGNGVSFFSGALIC